MPSFPKPKLQYDYDVQAQVQAMRHLGGLEHMSISVGRGLAAILTMVACSGSPASPGPTPAPPAPPPPTSVGDISLQLISVDPPEGASVPRASAQRFVARLRYSAGTAAAAPLFLVAQLRQFQGAVAVDSPEDFHFPTPDRSGQVEAVIDRTIIGAAGTLRIHWVLAMVNADRSTFAGASFTTSFPIA